MTRPVVRTRSTSPDRLRRFAEAEAPPKPAAPASKARRTRDAGSGASDARRPTAASVRDSRAALRTDVTTAQLRHRVLEGPPAAPTASDPGRFQQQGDAFVVRGRGGANQSEEDLPSPETRVVLRDPADVNVDVAEGDEASGMMGALGRAMADVQATSGLADAQYDALSDGAQADFDRVAVTIGDDDDAVRALDRMLVQGRFQGEDGEAILDELAGLSRDEVAEGLERDALVADMVQELADPSAINQQGYGTCVPTTASIHLAENDPAEYVRLVRGLASEEGRVRLANGDEISRLSNTIDEPEEYTGPERSQSSRLLVPALMEYGNGSRDYDPVDDSHQRDYGFFHRYDGRGLNNRGMDRIMEGITDQEYDSFTLDGDADGSVTDELARRTAEGEQVPVALRWREGAGHQILLTGVSEDFVYYTNPWGKEERMAREEFEARLIGVNQRAA